MRIELAFSRMAGDGKTNQQRTVARYAPWAVIVSLYALMGWAAVSFLAGGGVLGSPPPMNDGHVVPFDVWSAARLGAHPDECPSPPAVVRERSDVGPPPWNTWARFAPVSMAEAADILHNCLGLETTFDSASWAAGSSSAWDLATVFTDSDLQPRATESIQYSDDRGRRSGRTVQVSRDGPAGKVTIEVWIGTTG